MHLSSVLTLHPRLSHLIALLMIVTFTALAPECGALAAGPASEFNERIETGDTLVEQGDLTGALKDYRAAFGAARRFAALDPSNTTWQRGLSISHNRIGDVQLAQGDLTGALRSYRAALKIVRRLAVLDPSNTTWQFDLSFSHEKIGDVQKAQGKLIGALKSYSAALEIRMRLAALDPDNNRISTLHRLRCEPP